MRASTASRKSATDDAGREPERGVVRVAIAGQRDVALALDHERALLARVVAPHAGDGERGIASPASGSVTRCPA